MLLDETENHGNEFNGKPILDENGRLVPREDYRIATLNCGEEDFAVACMRTNLRYSKNTYFVCATHKNEKTCFSHSIRDTALAEIVLDYLKKHIRDVVDLAGLISLPAAHIISELKHRKSGDDGKKLKPYLHYAEGYA